MKLHKIIEVACTLRYSNGARRKFSGSMDEAIRYFSALSLQYNLRSLAGVEYDLDAIKKQMKQLKARRLEILAAKRASASRPRRHITKAQLISFRGRYQSAHYGKMRGWKKAACLEFRITLKTLNARMME